MGTQVAVERAPWTSLLKQSQATFPTHATNLGIFLQQKHPEPTVTACIGSHRWLMSGVCNSPHEAAPVPPTHRPCGLESCISSHEIAGKRLQQYTCMLTSLRALPKDSAAARFAETWVAPTHLPPTTCSHTPTTFTTATCASVTSRTHSEGLSRR